MAKSTGFLDYQRIEDPMRDPASRIKDYEEFHIQLSDKERTEQCGRCMNCGVPFCQAGIQRGKKLFGCPLHNLIPEWNDLVWMKNPALAAERLLKTNCFPEFTGRVCPAPCEDACICGHATGDAVSIRENELSIIEKAFEEGFITAQKHQSSFGGDIAVVGSGPAGLSAAWWLASRGHRVTVFEKDSRPGGLLTYGIPKMKLPQDIIERRIALMEEMGITFRVNTHIKSLNKLKKDYDAVILSCGARKPRTLSFEQQDLPGISYALNYLTLSTKAQLGELSALPETMNAEGKHVVIVGAGDSANDCVATAIRQGASDIKQLIRKPASFYEGKKLDYAHEEASSVWPEDIRLFQAQVKSAHGDKSISSLTITTPSGEQDIPCDLLVIASGFSGAEKDAEQLQKQSGEGVFTAGDMRSGASLVVLAIADGKRAAAEADRYLTGFSPLY